RTSRLRAHRRSRALPLRRRTFWTAEGRRPRIRAAAQASELRRFGWGSGAGWAAVLGEAAGLRLRPWGWGWGRGAARGRGAGGAGLGEAVGLGPLGWARPLAGWGADEGRGDTQWS